MTRSLHSSDPLFLKGGEEILITSPDKGGGEESEKLKKMGGSMVQGKVFLKVGAGTFPIQFFQGLSFLNLEITLSSAKLCFAFEGKLYFSATIIV